jgi:hypothetical protein
MHNYIIAFIIIVVVLAIYFVIKNNKLPMYVYSHPEAHSETVIVKPETEANKVEGFHGRNWYRWRYRYPYYYPYYYNYNPYYWWW